MRNYLIALEVILVLSTITEAKGQSTVQVCENGDSSNSIAAELSLEAIHQLNIQLQSIREILTESNQERKSQHDNVTASLQADDRRSKNQIESIHQFLNASLVDMKNQQDTVVTSLQIQSVPIQTLINTSFQQMITHHDVIIARLEAVDRRSLEQIESIHQFLNASLVDIKNQQDSVVTSLKAVDRRLQEQDINMRKVQSNQEHLNASLLQMKNQQDTVVTSLQAVDRRSQEQDINIKRIQSSNEFLNVSLQHMKTQLDTAVTSLLADDRRSQNQSETIYRFLNASFKDIKNQQDTVMARCSQEQVTSMYKVLNASFQQMKNQQDSVLRKLEALERDHSVIKNQTQKNSWKLEIAHVPEVGEIPVLPSIVNNWIVLMHRFDESLNFNRYWYDYKNGFGDMRRGEFWIGNEKIHRLTNRFAYTLRIEMYISGTWYYAEYSTFSVDSESNKYTLHLSGYSGNSGDSLTDTSLSGGFLGGMGYSTRDVDNDRNSGNCALGQGGGWWFNNCQLACLTCSYSGDFRWYTLRHLESEGDGRLRAARMMIKIK